MTRPDLTLEQAAAIGRETFGIDGTARDLGSQQDRNVRIDARGTSYVLKVSGFDVDPEALDLQNKAMRHVGAASPGWVPQPVPALDGREVVPVYSGARGLFVRLLTWLPGTPLRGVGYFAPAVLSAVGGLAGRTAAALVDFDHPAAGRSLSWDVQRVGDVVAAVAPQVHDRKRRELAERVAERAVAALSSHEPNLRRQVVHGDVTDWNTLARLGPAGQLLPCGLIDFGDVVRTWRAAECAVAAVAFGTRSPHRTVQDAALLLHAFSAVARLDEDEVAALPAMMAARAALSALNCAWQAEQEPKDGYVTSGATESWRRLVILAEVPFALAHAAFREACGLRSSTRSPTAARTSGAALVPDLDRLVAVAVDLSVTSVLLHGGAWADRRQVEQVVETASSKNTVPIGRYGEARLPCDFGSTQDEPATVHLGVDLFLPVGTPVMAPLPGRVAAADRHGLVLDLDGVGGLRLTGIEPAVLAEGRVAPGDVVGKISPARMQALLPAHLHVQLVPSSVLDVPFLAPASLATAWRAVCPDPSPLLGFEAAVGPPEPQAVLARRRRHVASPQLLYYSDDPPQIERGWRQWLYDVGGRPYLDVINNVAIVGHSHPHIEAAAVQALRSLNTNSRFLYDALGRFAERLVALLPAPLDVVFFVSTGSEANDLALRLAREVTGRRDVLCHQSTYHGWTTALIETERAAPGVPSAESGHVHGIVRPTADPASAQRSLEHARRLVAELGALDRPPAALITEPVLGNEGGIVLPAGHLQQLYGMVRDAGGLCIADEVQVGYGRLGHHFWAFEQQRVVPDVVTIAKSTGNGYPVAAVITTSQIADEFGRRDDLFSSVGGSPAACAVGVAVLEVLAEERLQDNAREVGYYLTERLRSLTQRHPVITGVHGMGLYRGIELVRQEDGPAPARMEAGAICDRMRQLGVIISTTGDARNVLKVKPPLCVTHDDIDTFASALDVTLTQGW